MFLEGRRIANRTTPLPMVLPLNFSLQRVTHNRHGMTMETQFQRKEREADAGHEDGEYDAAGVDRQLGPVAALEWRHYE